MNKELKEYKPLALVYFMNWAGERDALPLDNSKVDEFIKNIETAKMVKLDWTVINTFDIKEIKPYEKVSEIEMIFWSLEPKVRTIIAMQWKRFCSSSESYWYKLYSTVWLLDMLNSTKDWLQRMRSRIKGYYSDQQKEQVLKEWEWKKMTDEEKLKRLDEHKDEYPLVSYRTMDLDDACNRLHSKWSPLWQKFLELTE